jgi:hypothetical protein
MALQYVLTGFTQDSGCRVFAFARIEEDRTRTEFTVRADLALSRRYLIPMQGLPLLCRNFLARREDLGNSRTVIFNEDEMRLYATNCATAKQAAANKRKPAHRPVSGNLGAAWRGHTRQDAAHAPGTAPQLEPGAGDAHEEVATAAAAPAIRD